MQGHEIEDVDTKDLTPWEIDNLRIGVAALRRRKCDVYIAGGDPGFLARVAEVLGATSPAPLFDPSLKAGGASTFEPWDLGAVSRHPPRDSVGDAIFDSVQSPARPTPAWGGRELVEPHGENGKPRVEPLSDSELAHLLSATPEEIAAIRRREAAADAHFARAIPVVEGLVDQAEAAGALPLLEILRDLLDDLSDARDARDVAAIGPLLEAAAAEVAAAPAAAAAAAREESAVVGDDPRAGSFGELFEAVLAEICGCPECKPVRDKTAGKRSPSAETFDAILADMLRGPKAAAGKSPFASRACPCEVCTAAREGAR